MLGQPKLVVNIGLQPVFLPRLRKVFNRSGGSGGLCFINVFFYIDAQLLQHVVFRRHACNTLLFRKLLEELNATSLVVLLDNLRPFAAHEVSVLTAQFLGFSLRSRVTLLGL